MIATRLVSSNSLIPGSMIFLYVKSLDMVEQGVFDDKEIGGWIERYFISSFRVNPRLSVISLEELIGLFIV